MLATALLAVAAYAAQSADARNVYITQSGVSPGEVAVVDDSTNTISTTVPLLVLGATQGIAITPDGSKAYVAVDTALDDPVSVITTADNTASSIPLGAGTNPYGVAVSPDGAKVYVTNNGDDKVSIVTVATGAVTSFPLDSASADPRGIAISPDGTRLYVAEYGLDRISIWRTSTNAPIGTVTVGDGPDGIAVTPDGSKLVVANNLDSTASLVTLSPLDVTAISAASLGGASARGVAITPDGSKAYITNSGGATGPVAVVNTTNGSVTSTFSVGANPLFPAINPAGTRLYVPNSGVASNSLSVIDTSNNSNVVSPVGPLSTPFAAAVVPEQPPATPPLTIQAAAACADTQFTSGVTIDVVGNESPIASYEWDFGDGKTETTTTPTTTHAYDKAGTYTAALTGVAPGGTSTQQVYTGQTMLRNGSSSATKSTAVTIASPAAPTVTVTRPQARKRYNRRTFRRINGTASNACGAKQVNYALALSKGGKCRFLGNTGELGRTRRSCSKPIFRKAKLSGQKWSKTLGHRLPKGAYRLYAKATSNADVTSSSKRIRFRLR